MANFDKPAFTWTTRSKTIDLNAQINDFEVPPVNPTIQAQFTAAKSAFSSLGGSGGGPSSYPIGFG